MPRKSGHAPKKTPGTAVDKRNGQKVALRSHKLSRFDPPAGLGEISRTTWETYWEDPVSELATPADRSLLLRWIGLVDRYHLLINRAMAEPEVLGSTRQKQASPFFALAMSHENAIVRLEAQLGIGPKNRAALGIAVLSEQRTLADLNREFEDQPGNGDIDGDEYEDPRVIPGTAER